MTPEVKTAICARVAANEGLVQILSEAGMPTLLECQKDREFAALYKQAKIAQYASPEYAIAIAAAIVAAPLA